MVVMLFSTDGSVTLAPPDVAKTICSVSPETLGAAACNSLMASDDSVFGKLNEFEYAVPTDFSKPSETISTMAQMMTTRRR